MADKKYPKDLHEIYSATKADVELKLSETETFVSSTTMKSFEVAFNTVNETNSQIREFISEKSKDVEASVLMGRKNADAISKAIAGITSAQAKMSGLDKAKDLLIFKQRLSNELHDELLQLKEKF